MKTIQKGFTLIELMIVIAIIGILAAIAIPAYQDYTIRAQVSEAMSLSSGIETALSDYYNNNGAWPAADVMTAATAGGLGFPGEVTGKYGAMALLANGVIQEKFSNANNYSANTKLNGLILGIAPALSANADIIWICGSETIPTTVATQPAANGTTITNLNWVPSACK
jgi:type IV pilus assembly protein PilA